MDYRWHFEMFIISIRLLASTLAIGMPLLVGVSILFGLKLNTLTVANLAIGVPITALAVAISLHIWDWFDRKNRRLSQ